MASERSAIGAGRAHCQIYQAEEVIVGVQIGQVDLGQILVVVIARSVFPKASSCGSRAR